MEAAVVSPDHAAAPATRVGTVVDRAQAGAPRGRQHGQRLAAIARPRRMALAELGRGALAVVAAGTRVAALCRRPLHSAARCARHLRRRPARIDPDEAAAVDPGVGLAPGPARDRRDGGVAVAEARLCAALGGAGALRQPLDYMRKRRRRRPRDHPGGRRRRHVAHAAERLHAWLRAPRLVRLDSHRALLRRWLRLDRHPFCKLERLRPDGARRHEDHKLRSVMPNLSREAALRALLR